MGLTLSIPVFPLAFLSSSSIGPAVALVVLSLAIILAGAEGFTNAVEWLGRKLNLSQGAVGSVLAAVGTALPETMIPIIAIVFAGNSDSHDIGVGAILGAPFLLSTAAFAVTGLGVLRFRSRRRTGVELALDPVVIRRDLGFFFLVYMLAIGVSLVHVDAARYVTALVLLGLYGYYVASTFSHQGDVELEPEELHPLYLARPLGRGNDPNIVLVVAQLVAALGLIVLGAHVFVANLEHIAADLSVPALALSLIIAPLATELPEKFNSVIWVRQGKDTLAMGNITGAMVFQSCIPVAVGITFTDWDLTETALVSAAVALGSSGLVYMSIRRSGRLSAQVLARGGLLWAGFVVYVAAKIALT